MNRRLLKSSLALCGALLLSPAFAQVTPTVRVKGRIEASDAQSVTIKTADGQDEKIGLAPNGAVGVIEKATLADIKQGDFVGTAAKAQPDGTLRAVEVHIFAESQRGTGEGFNPNFVPLPDSSMTNATVTSDVNSVDGHTLTLTYKGGEKKVVVTPGTIIVRFAVGDVSDLKAGQIFSANVQKMPDGTLQASRVQVGRDGASMPF